MLEGGIIAVGHHRQIVGRPIQREDDTGATLNLGDCFAYGLATTLREPLLYKGNDFMHTDVRSALD
jgi:ribonuclease VapC